MQKDSITKKVQDWYKWGAALGIFWGLAVAIFDLMMKNSPMGAAYISTVASVTDPIYTQMAVMTTNSPILLWLSNSIMSMVYVLIGYGVKLTGSALSGFWSFILQKITHKPF